MSQESTENFACRVHELNELETENKSLLFENKHLIDSIHALQAENKLLRSINEEQSCVIKAHEFVYGRVFTLFPLLPPELRIRIWQLSCSPRVVEIYSIKEKRSRKKTQQWSATGDIGYPIIRFICKESRNLFLREYILLGTITKYGNHNAYFNSLIDTLCLRVKSDKSLSSLSTYMQDLAHKKSEEAKKWSVRSLALIDYHNRTLTRIFSLKHFTWKPRRMHIFDEFPALEEVFFLYSPHYRPLLANQITIINPDSEDMLKIWEREMGRIKYLKAMDGFGKWADVRVTVAMIHYSISRPHPIFTDERPKPLIGPPDS